MTMNSDNIYKLHTDLIRLSKQIGILPKEVPRLVTTRPTIHAIKLASPRVFRIGNDIIDKRTAGYGECITSVRTIFVDTSRRKYHHITYHGRKGSRYRVVKHMRAQYRDFLHTLVEELVHYRFPYFQEGRKLEERIQQVLRGKKFPQKHIHLYAFSAAHYRKALEEKT
jgi:hypothetical protein